MSKRSKTYLVGGGIGPLAAAFSMPGGNISILEALPIMGSRMAYITSMFMPRMRSDWPLPVPKNTRNFAFISHFLEIADDVVCTVQYSERAAQMAVYKLLDTAHEIPPITPNDKSLKVRFEALVKALK